MGKMNIHYIIDIMRRMRMSLPSLLMCAIATLSLYSCTDELPYNKYEDNSDEGVEVSIPLSFSAAPMQAVDPETRADVGYVEATDDEKKITDFWFIEYNEKGVRVGLPRYFEVDGDAKTSYTLNDFNVIVPREKGQEYTCVIIANTRDKDMFNEHNRSKFSTLDSLRIQDKDVVNQEDLFDPDKGRYLLMSGWKHISKDTRNLEIDLVRNVSKVRVKLTDFPDDKLLLKYFQWCDVPWGKIFPHGTDANYKEPISRNWRQHTDFEILRCKEGHKGYDYYIPCNSWIPENITGSDNGTTTREEDATYFDIVCHLNNGEENAGDVGDTGLLDEALYKFSIYPSRDPEKKKQFNFKPNHYYEIEVSIKDIPGLDDPFFNELGYTDLRGSNCYMIDPNAKDIFKLHLDQVNKFWNLINGKDLLDDDPTNENNEWVAEVIWQDTDVRILDFSFAEKEDSEKDLKKFDGHGNSYFTFCPTASGTGNVIVGVRKRVDEDKIPKIEDREYFWSWHIWITDYKPDECPDKWGGSFNEWLPDKTVYPVTGGEVHTYINSVWEATNDNIVKHRFLMDRNLGAWSANPDDGYRTFGFYYQRGRKDPFPIDNNKIQKVYDIDGEEIEAFKIGLSNMITVSGKISVNKSVNNPYKFVNLTEWFDDKFNDKYQSSWFNNKTNASPYTEKCIFDPCPPGWMIPPKEAYQIDQDGTFGPKSGGKVNENNLGIDFNFYQDSPQTIWFPFNSTRGTGPQTGYYWIAPTSPSDSNGTGEPCIFNFADPTVGAAFTSALSSAGIRCMRVRTYYKNKDEK